MLHFGRFSLNCAVPSADKFCFDAAFDQLDDVLDPVQLFVLAFTSDVASDITLIALARSPWVVNLNFLTIDWQIFFNVFTEDHIHFKRVSLEPS